ncbi:hypothetical protein [Gracilibacillus thailandensis]|uniref:Uncharacterized protein n=1 Tax=Gracilibacillus thailandensis TaxID=563735 RepID=A0A6N7QZ85_9BACI|nr:hypothetical protein [Gracilibacillus thailandensis]MRI66020.1 hypothetical protein [Gracilibacillus thailandensis]
MPNYVPYMILTIISILILVLIIVHKRQFGVTVLFLCFSGMVYIAELFVMIIGNSYNYFPEVLSVPYYDNVLGAIVSNLFVIPILGVVAAMYKLRFRYLVLFAVMLVVIEWLFEWLDIYQTNWWRKEYTFICTLFFFSLSKFWIRALQLGTKWSRFLSLWMQGWSGVGTVMFIMSVATIRYYEFGFFENVYRDDILVSAIMGILKSLIFVIAIILFQKFRWRLLAPILVFGIDLPLYYVGILVIEIPFWIYTIIYLVLATLLLRWNQYAYSFICKMAR